MRLLFTTAFLAVLAVSPRAYADPMDITLSRLGLIPGTTTRCPPDGSVDCVGDQANFERLMSQMAMSVSTPVLNPARTVGYRHFFLAFEANTTNIQNASSAPGHDFWSLGTDGNSGNNNFQDGNLFSRGNNSWFRGTIRKGLPLGFELASSFGRLLRTSNWLWGFEVKWALLEGFRRGPAAILPDIAVRGSVVGVTGTRGYTLTVPTLDLTVSKGFVLGRLIKVTPYAAGQMVWTIADSAVIDLTPNNLMDNYPAGTSLYVFDKIRAWTPRVAAGLEIRYHRVVVNAAYRQTVGNPNHGLSAAKASGVPMLHQWTVDVGVGVAY